MDLLEKLACKFLVWRFRVGYGAECETSDLDDFKDAHFKNISRKEAVMHPARCVSCRAEETIAFLKDHIGLCD